jgi:hypothetical protein
MVAIFEPLAPPSAQSRLVVLRSIYLVWIAQSDSQHMDGVHVGWRGAWAASWVNRPSYLAAAHRDIGLYLYVVVHLVTQIVIDTSIPGQISVGEYVSVTP